MNDQDLGWLGIARLGLVQMALGSIVVLTTSTLNRVMVVELALPAMLPGLLVALHYAIQVIRPRLGHASDVGGRRTPWIIGGMAVLAVGGVGAACATVLMAEYFVPGLLLAIAAFALIGVGVGAAGTSLLVLLAKRVAPQRRAPAATIVWLMMIGGFIVTATAAGYLLDPFSPARLIMVSAAVSVAAFVLALLALRNVEGNAGPSAAAVPAAATPFRVALRETWADAQARRFTIFVFVSMLAYSAQDLILEPFAGIVYGMTPGESTRLSGLQHGGVLAGMLLVAAVAGSARGAWFGSLKVWTVAGCIASGIALIVLASGGVLGPAWPLKPTVFALGLFNGAFSIAAIGSMMSLAGAGRGSREGVRMGLWGAAQALAFGLGGLAGAAASDLARLLIGAPSTAYAVVFFAEGLLFFLAAALAIRSAPVSGAQARNTPTAPASGRMVGI